MRRDFRRTAPGSVSLYTLAIIVFTIIVTLGQGPSLHAQQRTPQQLAQGARCTKCHADVVAAFPTSVHGQTVKFLDSSEAAGCERCHGDATKHIRSAKPEDIRMTPEQENGRCLTCHAQNRAHRNWAGSAHDRKDIACSSCHSQHHPHGGALLRTERIADTCFTCHKDIQKALHQRSTHLFRTSQGAAKLECNACHNPHGGEGRQMLVAMSANDVCYTCHAEKRGPFLWEHPPVREDCFACHTAHGSNYPSLLRTQNHMLCQQCHMFTLSRHQTVAGLDVFTFNRGCVNCHSRIHGSNHPSGKGLTQ